MHERFLVSYLRYMLMQRCDESWSYKPDIRRKTDSVHFLKTGVHVCVAARQKIRRQGNNENGIELVNV